ncbi:MAG: putative sulfate exporter family transporter [Dehalococcoidales bacterium]
MQRPKVVFDYSSLYKKEDWWAVWIGFFILALTIPGIVGIAYNLPKVNKWVSNPLSALPGDTLLAYLIMFVGLAVIFLIAVRIMGERVKTYVPAFLIIFVIGIISMVIGNQATLKAYGLSYPLWALGIGLLISNTVGVPKWLKSGVRTELYIKCGLVVLGAEILFTRVLALGPYGLGIAWGVTPIVLYLVYLYGTRVLKMERELTLPIAAATSVCGVSAAIATGAACKAKQDYITIAVGQTLIFTVLMMVAMPALSRLFGFSELLAGAWIGGTVDSTGAVPAAGEMIGPLAMEAAVTIKMLQNVLIGIIAFVVATIWVTKVEKVPGAARPSPWEIWFRMPKFIVGFLIASLFFSFVLIPAMGDETVNGILKFSKVFRKEFFALAFVSIGLGSNFRELGKYFKGGKPLNLYWVGQTFNILLTLLVAWLLLGGVLFPVPAF